MRKLGLIALVSVAAIGAQAALITNEGATAPSTGILAQNLSTVNMGDRELSWRSDLIHSEIGQSFVATADGTAMGISLFQTSAESYATLYESPITFKLKVFSGNVAATAVELGSYTYDASVLGDGVDDSWIRFGLGDGVSLTSGNTYSFIMTFNSLVAAHRVNFQRTKDDEYTVGGELRPLLSANLYDAANFDTDPWDLDSAINPVGELAAGDLRFTVDTIPEPATLGLVALFGAGLICVRRMRNI